MDDRHHAEGAARNLNLLGFTTPRGLPWTGANLIRVFQQTALDGYIVYRNIERSHGRSVRRAVDGQPLYGETVRIPLPLPLPIERVAAVRKAVARRSFVKSAHRDYFLSGRLRGLCGQACVGAYRELRDRATYRCNGHRAAAPCDCQEILAGPLEEAVWAVIVQILHDREKLERLAREWLGDVPDRTRSYSDRIAEIDRQIEQSRKMRKKRLVALAAAMSCDGDGEADTDANIQAAIEELREEIEKKEQKLHEMRTETVEWLEETQGREERMRDVLRAVQQVTPHLKHLTKT